MWEKEFGQLCFDSDWKPTGDRGRFDPEVSWYELSGDRVGIVTLSAPLERTLSLQQ